MLRLLRILILISCSLLGAAQHPITFFTKSEAALVKASLNKYPLLSRSYTELKASTDKWLDKDIDVPFPKDPAGGYTHDKHKANYMLMFNSAVLYNITGDTRYARLTRNVLLKYAALNPTLKNHPQATSNSPGRIFWQALNDANWLVYTGMAYDLIYNYVPANERKQIENGAFKPEVDYFTNELKSWFNLIHNHGVWACAGVGIAGLATGNSDWVDMALYGTEKKGTTGFITQMDGLFSPDGYYTEGPYYVRYAILPYYLFATALRNARPSLKIFGHRDSILRKALHAGLQQSNTDGRFFAFNDALKEKDYTSNELVTAINVAWDVYGADQGLLFVAKKQDRVLLNKGGVTIAKTIAAGNVPRSFPYKSVEYVDGVRGDEGGISLIRTGKDDDLSTLIFKYTSHGLSHGHYDKLAINLYDKGNEILTDYGAVRFIGVEQKYGGRYLPETKSYASQTIAHNTITVDEQSHFNGREAQSAQHHSDKVFSNLESQTVQVVSAVERNAYDGVELHRTLYVLLLPGGKKAIVDVFNANSAAAHQYDLPFHYAGQLISVSAKYEPFTTQLEPLGKKNGYQYLWKEAEAKVKDSLIQLTFLNNRTYYSISSGSDGDATLFFTRSGAGDPNFNLRREPAIIIRKTGENRSFVNVVEVHGSFDPIGEFSSDAYSSVSAIKLLLNTGKYTVAGITINGKQLFIAQSNDNPSSNTTHSIVAGGKSFNWSGQYTIIYDNQILK